jgi:bacterioferritin-associated ferredoxin
MIVCLCRNVSDRAIRAAVETGARSADEVARATCAGTSCGCCRPAVEAILRSHAAPCREAPCAGCPRAASQAA